VESVRYVKTFNVLFFDIQLSNSPAILVKECRRTSRKGAKLAWSGNPTATDIHAQITVEYAKKTMSSGWTEKPSATTA